MQRIRDLSFLSRRAGAADTSYVPCTSSNISYRQTQEEAQGLPPASSAVEGSLVDQRDQRAASEDVSLRVSSR